MTGPLPSVLSMKKFLLTGVTAIAWLLPGHLAILAILLLVWGSSLATTANTAKARSTEARLAEHVTATAPAVNLVANGGTIGGPLTVSGNHTVNGSQTVTGNHVTNGTITSGFDIHVGNYLYASDFGSAGTFHSDVDVNGSSRANGGLQVTGTFQAGGATIFRVAAPGTIAGTGTNSQLTNAVNAIIGQVKNTNWFT